MNTAALAVAVLLVVLAALTKYLVDRFVENHPSPVTPRVAEHRHDLQQEVQLTAELGDEEQHRFRARHA